MPVDLRLRYNLNSTLFENFYVAYRLNAQVYQDKELDNANEFVHEFSFGNSYIREKNGVRRVVYSAFKVGQHEATYFDPDNGAERNVGGVDIGDRLNFRRYGPEIRFRQSGEKLAFGAFFKGQLRNYDDVEVVPEYDHEFFSFGVSTQYKFTSTSLLRIDLEGQTRSYGDRPSFDLDGRQRLGNPAVEYDYLMASIVARQRLTRRSWFGVEYERTDRSDGYVGYNDYIRDTFKVEARWRPNAKFRLQASARYSLYDYPNAFAFNSDTLAPKTLETAMGEVEARWRVTRRLTIIGELMHREAVSNDSRIQYDQNQVMVSVEWDY